MTAAKYVRTAREDDALVAAQLDELGRLARKLDIDDTAAYVDNGVSAEILDESRPAFGRLIFDIAAGDVDTVLVTDVDRITRNPAAWKHFADFCQGRGCAIELARYHKLSTA